MADPTGSNPPADPQPEPQPDPKPAKDEGTDWKAEARKWEQRAKENSSAAKRLADYEEAQKTEQQKLADRLEAVQQEAAAAKAEATRYRIATEYKLDEDGAKALEHIPTEDGMRSVAELLAARTASNGNRVRREGTTTKPGTDATRSFLRELTGQG
jgi:hypothetical protein